MIGIGFLSFNSLKLVKGSGTLVLKQVFDSDSDLMFDIKQGGMGMQQRIIYP